MWRHHDEPDGGIDGGGGVDISGADLGENERALGFSAAQVAARVSRGACDSGRALFIAKGEPRYTCAWKTGRRRGHFRIGWR